MPWKETCPMDERMKFIADYLQDEWSLSALCRHYGISRKTGYKWLARYQAEGPSGLIDRQRAPRRHPNEVPKMLQDRIVAFRAVPAGHGHLSHAASRHAVDGFETVVGVGGEEAAVRVREECRDLVLS